MHPNEQKKFVYIHKYSTQTTNFNILENKMNVSNIFDLVFYKENKIIKYNKIKNENEKSKLFSRVFQLCTILYVFIFKYIIN